MVTKTNKEITTVVKLKVLGMDGNLTDEVVNFHRLTGTGHISRMSINRLP